jgi:hypothetical protein
MKFKTPDPRIRLQKNYDDSFCNYLNLRNLKSIVFEPSRYIHMTTMKEHITGRGMLYIDTQHKSIHLIKRHFWLRLFGITKYVPGKRILWEDSKGYIEHNLPENIFIVKNDDAKTLEDLEFRTCAEICYYMDFLEEGECATESFLYPETAKYKYNKIVEHMNLRHQECSIPYSRNRVEWSKLAYEEMIY